MKMKRYVFLIALFVLAVIGGAQAGTIWVPDDYPTIQDAITAAERGDSIIVRPGTYVENIDFLGKAITLQSECGADATVIDGGQNGSVVTFATGEEPDSMLAGFTLTNGSGNANPYPRGGGIFCEGASPVISDCVIVENNTEAGAGAWFYNCPTPKMSTCVIADNTSSVQSAGVLVHGSALEIEDTLFYGNTAETEKGGGIMVDHNCQAVLTNCTFYGNAATNGGAISITHTTELTVANCILWNNFPNQIYDEGGNTLVVEHSDVQGGWAGAGNIDANPSFVHAVNEDFHLTFDSPCRNAGSNAWLSPGLGMDMEGDPRVVEANVDMGADEFYYHLYSTVDPIPGGYIDFNVVGWPGQAPVELYLGSGVLNVPWYLPPYGYVYLELPALNEWSIGSIPADGLLTRWMPVPSALQPGDSFPFQSLVGPFGGFQSTLTNLLEAEISASPPYVDAYWTFYEKSGNILHDVSGNGWDGTIDGATWIAGPRGGALKFDGTSNKVTTGFVPVYDVNDSFTWEAIAEFTDPPVYNEVIMGFENSDDGEITIRDDYYDLPGHVMTTARCDDYVNHGGGHSLWGDISLVGTGWHHFALVRDRSSLEYRLYVDHELQDQCVDNNDFIINGHNQPLGIGCQSHNSNWDYFFRGKISEVRISHVALSTKQFLPAP